MVSPHSSTNTPTPAPPETPDPTASATPPALWKILLGAGMATVIAYFTVQLLLAMGENLPPIPKDATPFAHSISVLVRYLLVGGVSLMAFMFGAVALGLMVYGLQVIFQKLSPS